MFKILKISFCFLFLLVSSSATDSIFAAEKIDINTAPVEDLVKIIHIGETRALELISLRPFSSLDDLIQIKGISEERIKDIKKQGLAWASAIEPESISQPELQHPLKSSDEGPRNLAKNGTSLTYPFNIVINEILPSPEGLDAENEWIEIFNKNDFEVDLAGWQIKDVVGKTKIYTFPKGTEISSEGFLVLKRQITKITLNNNGDSLNLIRPDGKIADEISYEKAPLGQSYNRTESGWIWRKRLTPGLPNISPASVSEPNGKTEEKKIKDFPKKKELASVGKQVLDENFSFSPISIASVVAVFSAIIILILKKKLVHNYPQRKI